MIITTKEPTDWKDLQIKVADILTECGFAVETEKIVETVRGHVEIDVYAQEVVKGRKYSIICECKYWKSNIPQNVIHGFRTVISDLGCNIGYIISTSNFQSGSVRATEYTNVELLTWETFQRNFFESWYESYFSPAIAQRLDPILTYSEPLLPNWFYDMTEEDKKSFFSLKDKYDVFGWMIMSFTPYARTFNTAKMPTLPLIERVRDNEQVTSRIPSEILNEIGFREFFEKCCDFGDEAISKFRYFRDKYKGGDHEG